MRRSRLVLVALAAVAVLSLSGALSLAEVFGPGEYFGYFTVDRLSSKGVRHGEEIESQEGPYGTSRLQ